ncbi:MAG: class I SAM-dependent methyltransferase, partial [Aeromicrobium sp.]
TVLDIGGGVGAVHHELLHSGAATAVDVDASRAYIAVAREEAERQGLRATLAVIRGQPAPKSHYRDKLQAKELGAEEGT